MGNTPEAVRKSLRMYAFIGAILFLGTVITWAVANVSAFDVGQHGFDKWDCILGFAIATIKASLVAAIFMHLNHERKAIYWIFGSSIGIVIGLFGLTALAKNSPIHDDFFYSGSPALPAPVAVPAATGH